MRELTPNERAHISTQIEQISAFLEHCYDGMCHDLKIVWTLRDGYDPVRNEDRKSYGGAANYITRKGQCTEIAIGYGDAYYGSSSLGHLLHDAAYDWRERLTMRLKVDAEAGAVDCSDIAVSG